MKVSRNFLIQEFVPKSTFLKWGEKSTWFISEKAVNCAEFYKSFFGTYYKNKLGADKVRGVSIVINNWHIGGVKQFSGYRPPDCTEGAKESQHRHHNAFDCEIWIVFMDGTRKEADYKEIHQVIQDNEITFMANGVTRIEDVSIASGWLHTDFAWIPNQKHILIIKP